MLTWFLLKKNLKSKILFLGRVSLIISFGISESVYFISFLISESFFKFIAVLIANQIICVQTPSFYKLFILSQTLVTNSLLFSFIPTFIFESNKSFQKKLFCIVFPMILFVCFVNYYSYIYLKKISFYFSNFCLMMTILGIKLPKE